MQAISSGDVESLTSMLAQDIVLYGDGGGKIPVAKRPVVGSEMVARVFMGLYRLMPENTLVEVAEVNAAPSLLLWQQDDLIGVVNFRIEDNQIKSIQNMFDTNKLKYLQQKR